MNATERDQLQQFLSALRQTRADPKDPTADGLIREAVTAQADAPYLLVQRAMGLGMALDAAQTRIAQLEAQCAQQLDELTQLQRNQAAPATASSNGSWMSGAQAWGRGPETPVQPMPAAAATSRFATHASPPARPAAMPASAPASTSAWGGGMMAQVATTAAGVVAGGLLFQGVQSLMGHHKPSTESNTASPLSGTQEEALPGLVSPQALADDAPEAGDASWEAGEDWA
ncbi:MAG: hypothetical protein CFE38_05270 [Comamonadaceae bacterium PBBC1]|nr:MAG: hypothetical protein CFE38_05270 [Comamonadaceae bacterium PBBC1]